MPIRDLLRKRDHIEGTPPAEHGGNISNANNVTIMRSDTFGQEIISEPQQDSRPSTQPKRQSRFRSLSGASSNSSKDKSERRLSSILNLRSPSSESRGQSINVPQDLPVINASEGEKDDQEAQWEKRATLLARGNASVDLSRGPASRPTVARQISDAQGDDDIQKAIYLHETGDLEHSTAMFGRLADPNGVNNALSQVLYGLALRHGWGIEANPSQAITYLSRAASNSAMVEAQALDSGMKRGGAAKGELVLAIFELANCYRNGWGVEKDPVAARKYYETCANLGDVDSMLEAARCYEDGFGGKKDKYLAAKYYRLAEQHGHQGVGISWIWKEKYNPK